MPNKEENSLFRKEILLAKKAKTLLLSNETNKEDLVEELRSLLEQYESLVKNSSKLAKISDSNEKRLKKIKDELTNINDSLSEKNQNLTLLSQIGKLVTSSLDIKEILYVIYNNLKSFLDVDILTFGIVDDNQNCVKYKNILVKGEYIPGMQKDSLEGKNLSALCVKSREELISNQFDKDYPEFFEEFSKQFEEKIYSMAYFPLIFQGNIIGILGFLHHSPETFQDKYIPLLKDMANFIAIGVDNANAYKKIAKRNKELKGTLEEIRNLNQGLEEEKQKSENLLLNILPSSIAERLKSGEGIIADYIESSTVLFADLVGFSKLSVELGSPEVLVNMLNEIFSVFDNIAKKHKLEKIKTIGDCYMMAGGVPDKTEDHAYRSAYAAIEIINYLDELHKKQSDQINFRIGLHTGDLVAGVIGQMKFVYDLWGDTVNTASRMESHGMPGKIHCSEDFYLSVKDKFNFEDRGIIDVKGKGKMHTYFLNGEV
ncbi:MAG: GAF domain-containing protein [Leptospiraceae bacterium]|nr:GAF domain-containing protein [Leptospiraceae bacterium]